MESSNFRDNQNKQSTSNASNNDILAKKQKEEGDRMERNVRFFLEHFYEIVGDRYKSSDYKIKEVISLTFGTFFIMTKITK